MSKVVVTCGTLSCGGAERVLSILSKYFADHFDSVEYVLWRNQPIFYPIDNRVKITNITTKPKTSVKDIFAFRKHIKHTNPDVIISFLTPFNMLTELATMGMNIKVVVAERNDPNVVPGGLIVKWLRNILYQRSSGILAQTEYAKSCFKGRLFSKTKVIYNPILMDKGVVGSGLKMVKENLFVSIGRLTSQKDQKTMIKAFSVFIEKHPEYKLVIYGEGELRKELEKCIETLGLEGKVLLPGQTTDVWNMAKGAKAFLLSSLYEGLSNAMIEALCLGLPVISTKVAGATDLIKDGVNGYLVDIKDSCAIAEAMDRIVDMYPNDDLGRNAVAVYDLLTVEKISQEWIAYINEILSKS